MKDMDNSKSVVASSGKTPDGVNTIDAVCAYKLCEEHSNIWQVICPFFFFTYIVSPERTMQAPSNINETYTLTY